MKKLTIELPDEVHAQMHAIKIDWGKLLATLLPIILQILGGLGGTVPIPPPTPPAA